jgi:hypothetical protein
MSRAIPIVAPEKLVRNFLPGRGLKNQAMQCKGGKVRGACMKLAGRLWVACLLLSVAAVAQNGRSDAPKSRKAHEAVAHKMPPHAARQLTLREKQERAQMRAEQRRQAKLAKRQRTEAMRRSRRTRKTALNSQ